MEPTRSVRGEGLTTPPEPEEVFEMVCQSKKVATPRPLRFLLSTHSHDDDDDAADDGDGDDAGSSRTLSRLHRHERTWTRQVWG